MPLYSVFTMKSCKFTTKIVQIVYNFQIKLQFILTTVTVDNNLLFDLEKGII